MANKIQIKRSVGTATIPALSNGELAYTANGEVLAIGSPSGTNKYIGGERFPGTLTANQALVANSTSQLNQILVTNVVTQFLSSNGSFGTSGFVLTSGGTGANAYWVAPVSGVAGTNTQIMYNNSGVLAGNDGFIFDNSTNNVTVGNTLIASRMSVGAGAVLANSLGVFTTGTVNAASFTVGALFTANSTLVNAAAINITGAVNTATLMATGLANVNSLNVVNQINTATFFATTSANVGGNVQITTSAYLVTGNTTTAPSFSANALGIRSGNSSITGAPQIILANTLGSTVINTTSISTTDLYGTIQTVSQPFITANNSNFLGGVAAASFVQNTDTRTLSGNLVFTGANVTFQGANLTVTGTNTYITSNTFLGGASAQITGNVIITSANVDATSAVLRVRDAVISGNLTVSGSVTAVDTVTLQVKDNFIALADQLATTTTFLDNVDTGWAIQTGNTSASFYSGMGRIAASSSNTNPYFRLFSQGGVPNSTILDTSGTRGTLESYLAPYGVGGLFIANATNITITGNSTVAVAINANTFSLTTPLPATSGGTGFATYNSGDILVANTGNALSKLAIGADGYVLQVSSTSVVWGVLDGGSF